MNDIKFTYTEAQQEIFFGDLKRFNIVTKGRRFGATQGAAFAFIEYAFDNVPLMLWGDTINANIDRYYERYFLPTLKQIPQKYWQWREQKKELRILDSRIDFRSEDNPANWEGFGYNIIFLNEAGIILRNDYLYTNAILPMLMDYSDSKLIAAGVPKGKFNKDGTEHKFYTLYQEALKNTNGNYRLLEYSSYDNPFLKEENIKELEKEIGVLGPEMVDQEIGGKFIDATGTNPFLIQYDKNKHESVNAVFRPELPIVILVDFNINPFAVAFAHIWYDREGEHFHIFDEVSIPAGSIEKMATWIKDKYGQWLPMALATGDAMGSNRDIGQPDNSSNWVQLIKLLGMNYRSQLKLPGRNPTHKNSRADCNYVLSFYKDFKINPRTCPQTVRDCKIVQCDAFGNIIKRDRKKVEQTADFLDVVRYGINTFCYDWLKQNRRA